MMSGTATGTLRVVLDLGNPVLAQGIAAHLEQLTASGFVADELRRSGVEATVAP